MEQPKEKIITDEIITEMKKCIRPGWKHILFSATLKPIFVKCINSLITYLKERGVTPEHVGKNGLESYIRPHPRDIFRAFSYFDPNNLQVIIVGQDPYPKPENAMGLSFSAPKPAKVTVSLRTIYKSLIKSDLLDEMPEHCDLTPWAKQGVLLINRFLTRSPKIEKNGKGEVWVNGNGNSEEQYIHRFWGEYTEALLTYLTDTYLKPNKLESLPRTVINHDSYMLHVLLWGDEAKKVKSAIKLDSGKVFILEAMHPASTKVPESHPDHFVNNRHFAIINEKLAECQLPTIDWDPNISIMMSRRDQFYTLRTLGLLDSYLDNLLELELLKKQVTTIIYNDGTDTVENKRVVDFLLANEKEIRKTLYELQTKKNPARIVGASDGGCLKNGSTTADSSYAVHFPAEFDGSANGTGKRVDISGISPRFLLTLDKETYTLVKTDSPVKKSTNSRGELLGTIHYLLYVIHLYEKTKIKRQLLLIQDSSYSMLAINCRIWKYLIANPTLPNVKLNKDLILILKDLLLKLIEIIPENDLVNKALQTRKYKDIWHALIQPSGRVDEINRLQKITWPGLTVIHQESHLKESEERALEIVGGFEYEKMLINKEADRLSSMALSPE